MKVRIKKDVAHLSKEGLLEWQPCPSSNGNWYLIRRRNLRFEGNGNIQGQQFIIRFFDALRADLEVFIHGRYFRGEKRLVLNPNHNGGGS